MYTLNAKAGRFVWYSRQESVRGFYYILHLGAYVQRERKEMKQSGWQSFEMWQIICGPRFKGEVRRHVWAIRYPQQNRYLPVSSGIPTCQAQQES